jgi:hypothetical protein
MNVPCVRCGRPVEVPTVLEQVRRCECGVEYYAVLGDCGDIFESVVDYLDVMPYDVKFTSAREGVMRALCGGTRVVAVRVEEDDSEEFMDTWIVFFSSGGGGGELGATGECVECPRLRFYDLRRDAWKLRKKNARFRFH